MNVINVFLKNISYEPSSVISSDCFGFPNEACEFLVLERPLDRRARPAGDTAEGECWLRLSKAWLGESLFALSSSSSLPDAASTHTEN